MPLQVAERAVVGQHVEPIRRPFEARPGRWRRLVRSPAYARRTASALVGDMPARDREQLVVGKIRDGIKRGRDDLDLAVRIEIGQRDFAARPQARPPSSRRRMSSIAARACRKVLAPASAAIRLIDPRQKGRNHLAQLGQHLVRARRGLPRADARACAAAALRTPGRSRRCRRSTASRPAACRAACRAPWPGSRRGARRRNLRRPSDSAARSAPAWPESTARRSRTSGPSCSM